jgi:S1-C subfamily serine protease
MINRIFLTLLLGLIAGCTHQVRNPVDIKKSFVKVHKEVKVKVCGENEESKSNECKTLMNMNSSGSGAIVWNEFSFTEPPRTLILTADHVCEDPELKFTDFDPRMMIHIRENLKFKKEVELIADSRMFVVTADGARYKVKKHPWVRNVSADTCIIEASINKPSLHVGSEPGFGDKLLNVAAPKGIFHPNKHGGGVYYTDGFYNGDFIMAHDDGGRIFAMFSIIAAPGSSGSPVVNLNGEIVGMIHSIDSRYCSPLTGECNSPVSYGATQKQVRETLLEALAAIKRGESIKFDYKKVNQ